jgi:hypothetical protein
MISPALNPGLVAVALETVARARTRLALLPSFKTTCNTHALKHTLLFQYQWGSMTDSN